MINVLAAAAAVATPEPPAEETPIDVERYASLSLAILTLLLIGALCTSYYLQVRKIRAVHETVISIFSGMVVGLIIRHMSGHMVREMVTFKHTLFFNLLLPPIILNSGYELKQENFFRNFGVILTFAFAGTFISAVAIGVIVYLFNLLHIGRLDLTLVECLILGSTLSATDPVTILAIFNTYKVDPKLYSVIFGESILNDAVSIVLYETLSQFHGEDIAISSFFHGTGIFLLQFSISMALGVAFGLCASLGLKHSNLNLYPGIESCLVALTAYTSYFFSNGIAMSGIVSLLFCGITLKHYAYHNMSRKTQRTTKSMFSVLAQLSENFIFIYLGITLFTQDVAEFKPLFIIVATIAVVLARYLAVFPLSSLINWFFRSRGQRQPELPHSYQMMLFWAGLRGAVGVALAAGIAGKNAAALRTTVLVVVVITVVVFGGTTSRMLDVMGIRMGVEDDEGASSDEEDGPLPGPYGYHLGGVGGSASYRRSSNGPQGFNHFTQTQPYGKAYSDEPDESITLASPTLGPTSQPPLPTAPPFHSGNRTVSAPQLHASTSSADLVDESDNEVLPSPASEVPGGGAPGTQDEHRPGMVFRDGRWFTALDERYLLPLFSNSVASRRHHARKQLRRAASPDPAALAQGSDAEDSDDGTAQFARAYPSRRREDFSASMGSFLASFAAPPSDAGSVPPSPALGPGEPAAAAGLFEYEGAGGPALPSTRPPLSAGLVRGGTTAAAPPGSTGSAGSSGSRASRRSLGGS